MDFSMNDEQRMLSDSLDRLLADCGHSDPRKTVTAGSKAGGSNGAWQALCELGLPAMPFSEEVGGMNASATDMVMAMTAFGRHGSLEPAIVSIFVAGLLLREYPADPALATLKESLVQGDAKVAFALAETTGRYEPTRIASKAERTGTGYILSGSKAVVLGGDEADRFLISANTSGDGGERPGLSLFLVDRSAQGLTVINQRLIDGRGAADLHFSGLAIGQDARVGPDGRAIDMVECINDIAALGLAADALGAVERINSLTLEYLQMRHQFGRPIGSFQTLQHRMVDMVHEYEHLKSLVYIAAARWNSGDVTERKRSVSAVKRFLGTRSRAAAADAIQMHGAIGMTQEYELGRCVKRVLVADMLFGNADHHVERLGALLCA
ncbi:MAG: acyl-CoA dehydrogenase family protein [Pseudomonadota bacterium]